MVTEHSGGDAAEPEDDDRAEHRFLHDADDVSMPPVITGSTSTRTQA